MKTKYTVAVCLTFALLFAFAACSKSRYGVLIVDEKGMEHVIATNEQGATIQDGKGNLVEIITDSDSKKPVTVAAAYETNSAGEVLVSIEGGNYASQAITFPEFIENKDSVEIAPCVIPIPKGWEHIGESYIVLQHTETLATIEVNSDKYSSVDEAVEDIEKVKDSITGKLDFTFDREDIKLGNYDAIKFTYGYGTALKYIYVLQVDFTIYRFTCTVETDKADQVDFESVLTGIEYRLGGE